MTVLQAKGVSVKIEAALLVDEASLSVTNNEMVALLGPNGAGKTSLLRALLGIAPRQAGQVMLAGRPIDEFTDLARARAVSYLPQTRGVAWPSSVLDVVALGRFAHGVGLGPLTGADRAAVDRAIQACQLEELVRRRMDTLSGGELARVHCARVYAANAPLMIADEPAAGLDPQQQHRIFALLQAYATQGHSVLTVVHDVNLALRYASRLVWMREGQIVADLAPAAVTSELVEQVYDVRCVMVANPADGVPQVLLDTGQ